MLCRHSKVITEYKILKVLFKRIAFHFFYATLVTVLSILKKEVEQVNVNDRLNVQETFSTTNQLTQL